MHHPTDRIAHTTVFVTPVVVHSLEREIAQWVQPMKDRSNDPSHHERTFLPRSYISLSYHGAISRSLTTELYLALLPQSYISLSYHGAISRFLTTELYLAPSTWKTHRNITLKPTSQLATVSMQDRDKGKLYNRPPV